MQVIKFEQKDSVGHIILANPPKNLIASDFSNSLKQAVHEAGESDIRALLVRAEGPNFTQGGDVLDFLEKSTNQFRTFIAECNQSFRAIEALQIPTVAAVRGAAFGGACGGSGAKIGGANRPLPRGTLRDALRADVGRHRRTIGYRQLRGSRE